MANTQTRPPKQARKPIRGRLKTALDLMVWQGKPWNDAAQEANFTTSAMRKALERAHVRAYLSSQREVFRSTAGGRNLHRLIELRDQDENRNAAVRAAVAIEQIGDSDKTRFAGVPRQPGMCIVVVQSTAPAIVPRTIGEHRSAPALPSTAHDAAGDRYFVPYHAPHDLAPAPDPVHTPPARRAPSGRRL